MDVEEYLEKVRLEEESLPKVTISHDCSRISEESHGKTAWHFSRLKHIDDEYQRLDTGFSLTEDELNYFRLLKDRLSNSYGVQKSSEESSLWKFAKEASKKHYDSDTATNLNGIEEREEIWTLLFNTSPPSISTLCENGLHFGSIQDALRVMANHMCRIGSSAIPATFIEWLFVILLMLDELHAVSETISYELQRTRRAILRRCASVEPYINCDETAKEIAALRLVSCIIATHFNQR